MFPSLSRHRGIYVVMGVSGSGKTTVGTALASALGLEFVEGDKFHPATNVRRMTAGIALTDEDRAGWLRAIADRVRKAHLDGRGLVVSCSALKRAYRDVLRAAVPDVRFIFLDGPADVIGRRLARRKGHYMPASLLGSQIATLQRPAEDEQAWAYDVTRPPDDIIADLVQRATG